MSTITLRDYQQTMIQDALTASESSKSILIQSPTGSGKTITGAALISTYQSLQRAAGVEVVPARVIVHRDILVQQWYEAAAIFDAELYVVTAQQWHSDGRVDNGKRGQIQVVDEAHHYIDNTWHGIVEEWVGDVSFGFTATPWRMEKLAGYDHLWDSLILGPDKSRLIADGNLLPARVFSPKWGEIEQGEAVTTSGARIAYTHRVLSQRAAIRSSLDFWERHASGERTIVFAHNIKHAVSMMREADKRGIPNSCVFGTITGEERENRLAAFAAGTIQLLFTVEVLTEGLDIPSTSAVLIVRPTESLRLYLQMVGRAVRPYGDKKFGKVLDVAGNYARFGHPDDDYLWSRFARATDLRMPILCEKCGTVNQPDAEICVACGALLKEPGEGQTRIMITCGVCGRRRKPSPRCPHCGEEEADYVGGVFYPARLYRSNILWVKDAEGDPIKGKPERAIVPNCEHRYEADIAQLGAIAWTEEADGKAFYGLRMREEAKSDMLGWQHTISIAGDLPVERSQPVGQASDMKAAMDKVAAVVRRLVRVS